MSGGPTIVVKFGESVSESDQSLFLVELDDVLNVDDKGEVKSQFYPGDEIFFLMHYNQDKLEVVAIKSTAGQVVVHGAVGRPNKIELLFTDPMEPIELPHNPSGGVSAKWFGRTSSISRSERSLTASDTPCLGEITYSYSAISCKLISPPVELEAEEEFPVAVVIYVEALVVI